MTELFFPKPETAPSPTRSREDLDYADAFKLLADVVHDTGDLDATVLLLSTCRNIYLTVNALFVDIAEVLGRGTEYSMCERAIYLLKQGDVAGAAERLHEAGKTLAIYQQKRGVWEDRESLYQRVLAAVAKLPGSARDRLDRLLVTAVRTEDTQTGQSWDEKYYQLSTGLDPHAEEHLNSLDESYSLLKAVTDICRAIVSLSRADEPEQLDLLPTRSTTRNGNPSISRFADRWQALGELLWRHARTLGLAAEENAGTRALTWSGASGPVAFTLSDVSSTDAAPPIAGLLLDHLYECVRAEYRRLGELFRPNVGVPPLPPPYRIDLTDRAPRTETVSGGPSVRIHSFHQEPPTTVRVALPLLGIPHDFYSLTTFRFEDPHSAPLQPARRSQVEQIAKIAIETAHQQGAQVVVFPEYFLPRAAVPRLAGLAAKLGLVLIAGHEGAPSGQEALLANEVLIFFPERAAPYRQMKQRASVYEPSLSPTDELLLFERTKIGTFGVIVCSDFLEQRVMEAFAQASKDIHILFVCSCNPQPELFAQLAAADAVRLYSHVVIVNNHTNDPATETSGRGTLVCSPTRTPLVSPASTVNLPAPGLDGVTPKLALYDLSLEAVLTSRQRPISGFLPIPASRSPSGRRAL